MHQDQRIGLALGVLLVGACAAFFFRNETHELPNVPQLKHASELDARIAERPTRPYIKGIEAVEVADRRRSRAASDQESGQGLASSSIFSWDLMTLMGRKPSADKIAANPNRIDRFPPLESDVQEFAPITLPTESHLAAQDEGVNATDPMDDNSRREALAQAREPYESLETHVVQKGETLSSIAAKMLGDRNRYHELFEANRDQLEDPNEVRLGMTLRIPRERKQSATATASRTRPVPRRDLPVVESAPSETGKRLKAVPPVVDIPSDQVGTRSTNTTAAAGVPKLPSDDADDTSSIPMRPTRDAVDARRFIPVRRAPMLPTSSAPIFAH